MAPQSKFYFLVAVVLPTVVSCTLTPITFDNGTNSDTKDTISQNTLPASLAVTPSIHCFTFRIVSTSMRSFYRLVL